MMKKAWLITIILLMLTGSQAVSAQTRLPIIPIDQYTPEQVKAAQEFELVRKRAPWGPFAMLMYSPELMNNARSMGDYLRYKSSIPNMLSEFAILRLLRASGAKTMSGAFIIRSQSKRA